MSDHPENSTENQNPLLQEQATPDSSADTAAPEQSQDDVTPSLEELLKAAELKAAEHHDAWLRAKAEGENVRRRAQEDIAKASKFAAEKFAGELLAVKDSLEAALSNENQSAEALKSGVELTLKQLGSAFEKSNLVDINPLGEKFDPHKHQAISQIESEGEPNTVLTVLQKGYALNGRVIRPALVIVSKAMA
ncbi:Protein GrpE [Georgfuchsia toluolica]|uniref:Protein GrpE n=1 Tax=Georgfuchsia toluolica TaxID=424218 RepID=A0A916N3R4_9PROT|nr:nucleotide exchange factor GrpE [Georgfuchsia toluolica]CAG4885371.1 Protein GrpE [Georgfuchsia toluolica]